VLSGQKGILGNPKKMSRSSGRLRAFLSERMRGDVPGTFFARKRGYPFQGLAFLQQGPIFSRVFASRPIEQTADSGIRRARTSRENAPTCGERFVFATSRRMQQSLAPPCSPIRLENPTSAIRGTRLLQPHGPWVKISSVRIGLLPTGRIDYQNGFSLQFFFFSLFFLLERICGWTSKVLQFGARSFRH